MFQLDRILRFAGHILQVSLPFLLLAFFLSFLSRALLVPPNNVPQLVQKWRFWLDVGLGVLPVIIAALIPFWLAGRFISAVYNLGGWKDGVLFLLRHRFGNWSFGPWAKIEEGRISINPDNELARIGGPGGLLVGIDSAIVLERAGKFSRVEGPGIRALEAFETIYDIIDLRPKSYCYNVSAMSREGIPLDWEVEVRYQIADDDEETTEQAENGKETDSPPIYPVSKENILRASTCKWIREESWPHGQDMDWEGLIVISRTEGALRSIIARLPLDQLIGLTSKDEIAAREKVQQELEAILREKAPALGAKILGVKLHKLEVQDDVTQQWIRAWQARWQRWSAGLLAQGEAARIYLYETAKAEAQARLIASIARGLADQMAKGRITPEAINQVILMRLFSVLDRADFAASSRVFFPTQALDALANIRHLLENEDQNVS